MRKTLASLLAAFAFAIGGNANAATYDVNLTGLFFAPDNVTADVDVLWVAKNKTFNDTFNLLLGDDSNVWFGAGSGGWIDIDKVELFDSTDTLVALGQQIDFGWGLFSISGSGLGPLLLEAGSYYFSVSGQNGSSYFPGFYKFAVLAEALPPTPVPLPPAMILLATGLVGLAGLARRRKAAAGTAIGMQPAAA